MAEERLRLIAEMRDRLSPQLRRLKTIMESTGRVGAFRKLAKDMSLAERSAYRFGFALGRTVKYGAIAAGAGAVAASAAFVKFGKDSADALDDQAAFAKQINFSADSLRTLQGVARRYNVDQEQLRGGLQKFTTSFGRLKQNQGAFYTYLKKTNPALAEQFKHVGSSEEAFVLLSDAISKTSDPAKRAALAKAAGLGQQFLRFFADGPEDLKKTIAEVIRLQGRLGPKAFQDAADYGDAMDNIGLAWEGLRDKLTGAALPVVTPLLNDLAKFMANNREGIASGFKDIATDVGAGLRVFGDWTASLKKEDISAFWGELKQGADAVGDIAGSIRDLVGAIKELGGWKAVLAALVLYKAGGGLGGLLGGLGGGGASPGGGGKPGGGAPGLLGLLSGPFKQVLLYQLGKWGINAGLDALPHPDYPPGYDPRTFDPWEDLKKQFQTWETKPGTRTHLDPAIEEQARRAANEFRQDPEGTRGRMRVQLGRRADVEAAAKTIAEIDETIRQLKERGADKTMAKEFADMVATRDRIAARVEQERAADIGTTIGTKAGDSFLDRMQKFFQQMSYSQSGSPGGSGGARLLQASYRPGGGASWPRGGASSFSGAAGGMLGLIAAAEGTGNNYNATFGNGLLTGGGVNLTGMTLDQIDALQTQMLRHPRNKWNTSALGRYQFVRTRLRDLRHRYGLPGSALFSPALQDALGRASLAERGGSVHGLRNEWEGLKKVPDNELKAAMQRHRKHKREQRQTIEGSASVDIRFPNGVPAGTKVGAAGKGLFREVNLDTGRAMQPALG